MIQQNTITLLVGLVLSSLCCASQAYSQEAGFQARREAMLDMLASDEMLTTPITSESYGYRRAWMHYDASLAKGVNLAEANAYFATSPDVVAEEWQNLMLLRTYYSFKDSNVLQEATKTRMLSVLQEYKQNFDLPGNSNPERYGTKGNHSIVGFSSYLLLDQLFGNGPDHSTIETKLVNWVQEQGRRGRDEVNSTHYLERSLTPLLNLYDYSTDPQIQKWSQMAIDQLVAESAVMSLNNVRGGPWVRSHQGLVPGHEEINDGRQDSFYVAGYQFFGGMPLPDYVPTEQVTLYSFLETTSYRPSQAIIDIADSEARGTY